LQPRLPSLFESSQGGGQLPVPVADTVTRDVLLPAIPASYHVKQDETLSGDPVIEPIPVVEHRQKLEGGPVMTRPEKDLGAAQDEASVRMDSRSSRAALAEKQSRVVFDAVPAPIRKSENKPLQDGSPFEPQETTLGAKPAVEADKDPPLQENGDKPQREPRLFNEKQAVRAIAQRQPAGDIPQPPVHPTVSASATKPVFTPLTVEPPVHKNGVQPEIPARNETVVQVRIGRIEVRAVNPPASLPRPADRVVPEKPKMSLEDYLRQREKKQ
jgi:hypothetical protein